MTLPGTPRPSHLLGAIPDAPSEKVYALRATADISRLGERKLRWPGGDRACVRLTSVRGRRWAGCEWGRCECAGFERVCVYLCSRLKRSAPVRGSRGGCACDSTASPDRWFRGGLPSPVAPRLGAPLPLCPAACRRLTRDEAGTPDPGHSLAPGGRWDGARDEPPLPP